MVFTFVPETFWERKPVPRSRAPARPNVLSRLSSKFSLHARPQNAEPEHAEPEKARIASEPQLERPHKDVRFGVGSDSEAIKKGDQNSRENHHVSFGPPKEKASDTRNMSESKTGLSNEPSPVSPGPDNPQGHTEDHLQNLNIPAPLHLGSSDGISPLSTPGPTTARSERATPPISRTSSFRNYLPWAHQQSDEERAAAEAARNTYSGHWREREAKSFVQQLRPWHGRLNNDKWLKVAVRPFILFTYPAVLWSSAIYACSVGWLIVVSESVTVIYREDYYHFNALQTGLMYISPFIGGVLGTAVAGKVSDVIVKAMARRNGGLYEPEFRLVMAIPVAITTIVGLMGYGWSAEVRDQWIVPTVFLGVVSFGCSLGSTTSITFCVDSYRQYAGEALVTLNFSKNIFHGLVFSFFVTGWIESDGAKDVFIWIGVIQLIVLVSTVPMFIFGKRARMWTIRRNLMEKF